MHLFGRRNIIFRRGLRFEIERPEVDENGKLLYRSLLGSMFRSCNKFVKPRPNTIWDDSAEADCLWLRSVSFTIALIQYCVNTERSDERESATEFDVCNPVKRKTHSHAILLIRRWRF